jgi:glucosamine 6-phosphate synthetase-like amidotransferase/phosphosugar isomerase protein
MCGIAGSNNKEKFQTLYKLNSERGNFASSFIIKTKNHLFIRKNEGIPPFKFDETDSIEPVEFFALHTQAPTSSQREWSEETSHPFQSKDWLCLHNGILVNFEELKQQNLPKHTNPVDSSIIPALLQQRTTNRDLYDPKNKIPIEVIIAQEVEKLKGTFACWIYYIPTGKIYLIRCSSTLFANKDGNFSSVQFENSELVEEGWVFEVTNKGLVKLVPFVFNSPFLSL